MLLGLFVFLRLPVDVWPAFASGCAVAVVVAIGFVFAFAVVVGLAVALLGLR